jgi:hypothetical protein
MKDFVSTIVDYDGSSALSLTVSTTGNLKVVLLSALHQEGGTIWFSGRDEGMRFVNELRKVLEVTEDRIKERSDV